MSSALTRRVLPWQASPWADLNRALESQRLGHALLLSGRPGTGRGEFAEALARQLLCAAPTAQGNCGSCKACELMEQGVHPDCYRMEPEEPGKAIGIERVRAMLRFIAQTSALGGRRVVRVAPLESLTLSACNAFLKGLEEPGDDTHFLLVYSRGRPLPATIRSRCQEYPLPVPEPALALQWLNEQAGTDVDEDELAAVMALVPGRPLEALSLLRSDDLAAGVALHEVLPQLSRGEGLAAALQAASALPPASLLSALQHALQLRLRAAAIDEDRAKARLALRAGVQASERLRALQRALDSGSNPNPELLRHSALQAYAAGCEAATLGAKLPPV